MATCSPSRRSMASLRVSALPGSGLTSTKPTRCAYVAVRLGSACIGSDGRTEPHAPASVNSTQVKYQCASAQLCQRKRKLPSSTLRDNVDNVKDPKRRSMLKSDAVCCHHGNSEPPHSLAAICFATSWPLRPAVHRGFAVVALCNMSDRHGQENSMSAMRAATCVVSPRRNAPTIRRVPTAQKRVHLWALKHSVAERTQTYHSALHQCCSTLACNEATGAERTHIVTARRQHVF
jgi:hypothetical protein